MPFVSTCSSLWHSFVLLLVDIQIPCYHFLQCWLLVLLSVISGLCMFGLTSGISILLHLFMVCVFLKANTICFDYNNFVVGFEVRLYYVSHIDLLTQE